MTYLDEIASEIKRRVPERLLPNGDTGRLFLMYALLALAKGTEVTGADVHNAWAVWMLEQNPEHHAIKPFDELDAQTKAADSPYVEAIRKTVEAANRDHSNSLAASLMVMRQVSSGSGAAHAIAVDGRLILQLHFVMSAWWRRGH